MAYTTAQEGQCQKWLATGSCWPLLELGTGEAVCTAGACQSSALEPGSKTLFLSQCPSSFLPLSNLKHQEAFVISHRNSGAFGLGGSESVKLWLQSSFWPGLQSSEGPTAAGGSTSKMAHLRGQQVGDGCWHFLYLHVGISTGMLESPHNLAAGFP